MNNFKSAAPVLLLLTLCLTACRDRENSAGQVPSVPTAEKAALPAEMPTQAQPREATSASAEKPLPKLVPVKPLGDRTDSRPMVFQSTAPVAAGGAGNSITIINNAVPEVQGTAVPAQAPDPKKPAAQPVY